MFPAPDTETTLPGRFLGLREPETDVDHVGLEDGKDPRPLTGPVTPRPRDTSGTPRRQGPFV